MTIKYHNIIPAIKNFCVTLWYDLQHKHRIVVPKQGNTMSGRRFGLLRQTHRDTAYLRMHPAQHAHDFYMSGRTVENGGRLRARDAQLWRRLYMSARRNHSSCESEPGLLHKRAVLLNGYG